MKKNLRMGMIAILLSLVLGSGIVHCEFAGGSPPPVTVGGILYVLDRFNDVIYIFDNATTISGLVAPNRSLSGDTTEMDDPTTVVVDAVGDILYVADKQNQEVLAFSSASTINGNVSPLRIFPGPANPGDMYYDSTNDSLYVTDLVNSNVLAWDSVRNLPNATGATRTIKLGYTPGSIAVDTVHDFLYVGNTATAAVNAYEDASILSTGSQAAPVNRSFTDSSQSFVNMNSMAVNSPNNILWVLESANPSLEAFDNASTLSGAEPATRELEGTNTGLSIDTVQVIFNNNTLYINQDFTHIAVWTEANQLKGDVTPNRILEITPNANTQIISFDLDSTR